MNNEKLLDEIEQWLGHHHTTQGHAFSEESLLERIRNVRVDIKRKSAIEGTAKSMNAIDIIPPMIDPLGKHWKQPLPQFIFIRDGKAHMDAADFRKLSEYNTSIPTGVYPGKMWKRRQGDQYLLCWFGEEQKGNCEICFMPIEVAQEVVPA